MPFYNVFCIKSQAFPKLTQAADTHTLKAFLKQCHVSSVKRKRQRRRKIELKARHTEERLCKKITCQADNKENKSTKLVKEVLS